MGEVISVVECKLLGAAVEGDRDRLYAGARACQPAQMNGRDPQSKVSFFFFFPFRTISDVLISLRGSTEERWACM